MSFLIRANLAFLKDQLIEELEEEINDPFDPLGEILRGIFNTDIDTFNNYIDRFSNEAEEAILTYLNLSLFEEKEDDPEFIENLLESEDTKNIIKDFTRNIIENIVFNEISEIGTREALKLNFPVQYFQEFQEDIDDLSSRNRRILEEIKDVLKVKDRVEFTDLVRKLNSRIDFRVLAHLLIQDMNTGEYTYNIVPLTRNLLKFLEESFSRKYEDLPQELEDYINTANYFINSDHKIKGIKFSLIPITDIPNDGAFFNFINSSCIDLSELQIYKKSQLKEILAMKDKIQKQHSIYNHCIIHSLNIINEFNSDPEKVKRLPKPLSISYEKFSEKIESLKSCIKSEYLGKFDLEKISEKLEINISLYTIHSKNYRYNKVYGNNLYLDTIYLVLGKSHYFPKIRIPITKYFLDRYIDLDRKFNWKKWEKLYIKNKEIGLYYGFNGNTPKKANKEINRWKWSHHVVEYLDKGEFFLKSTILSKFERSRYIEKDDRIFLNKNIDEEVKLFEFKERPNKEKILFFADWETFDNDKIRCFSPYQLGITKLDKNNPDNFQKFENLSNDDLKRNTALLKCFKYIHKECVSDKNFWKKSKKDKLVQNKEIIVYFHNLKFDLFFIEQYSFMKSKIDRSGIIYSAKVFYKGITITLKDSYKMISQPLSKFQDAFGLDFGKQEAIPYKLYSYYNYNLNFIDFDSAIEIIKKREKEDFNLDLFIERSQPYLIKSRNYGIKFKHREYLLEYLKYDCLTLKAGLEKFSEVMLKSLNIDSYNFLTQSSLASFYIKSNGAFEDCYEVKGNLRDFIQESIIGGRCCTRWNSKWKILLEFLEDNDACSLYPSAISRICKGEIYKNCIERFGCKDKYFRNIKGFPKGIPKLIPKRRISDKTDKDGNILFYNKRIPKYLAKKYWYVIKIEILDICKDQQIPFITYKDKSGKRVYTNHLEKENSIIIVDRFTLEDYIEYQKIKYIILDGIYWNEGGNDKFGPLIENLYSHRLECKRKMKSGEDVALNNVLQQIDKLLMNSSYGSTMLKPNKSDIVYKSNYKGEFDKFVKKKCNLIKNITVMNYVNRIEMFINTYEHFNLNYIGGMILSMSKRIMNEVMGLANDNQIPIFYQDTDSMHMLSSDYDKLGNLFKEKYKRELFGKNMGQFHGDFEMENAKGKVLSKKCMIVGKKCYFDELIDEEDKTDFHLRLKGIGSRVIKANYKNIEKVYEDLIEGKIIKFDRCKAKLRLNFKGIEVKSLKEDIILTEFPGGYYIYNRCENGEENSVFIKPKKEIQKENLKVREKIDRKTVRILKPENIRNIRNIF